MIHLTPPDLPPLHQDFLLAHHHGRGAHDAADMPWHRFALHNPDDFDPSSEASFTMTCTFCAEAERSMGKRRAFTPAPRPVTWEYFGLPPSVRALHPRSTRLGYLVGVCYTCRNVGYIPIEERPPAKTRHHGGDASGHARQS